VLYTLFTVVGGNIQQWY